MVVYLLTQLGWIGLWLLLVPLFIVVILMCAACYSKFGNKIPLINANKKQKQQQTALLDEGIDLDISESNTASDLSSANYVQLHKNATSIATTSGSHPAIMLPSTTIPIVLQQHQPHMNISTSGSYGAYVPHQVANAAALYDQPIYSAHSSTAVSDSTPPYYFGGHNHMPYTAASLPTDKQDVNTDHINITHTRVPSHVPSQPALIPAAPQIVIPDYNPALEITISPSVYKI